MAYAPPGTPPDPGDFPRYDAGLNIQRNNSGGVPAKAPVPIRTNAAALRAQRQYQQSQIETASPTRLIVLLYDGAVRFATQGLEALNEQRYEDQNLYLLKTQRIVTELMTSLDRNAGGDVAANLYRIYSYVMEQLVRANMQDDPALLQDAIKTLTDLRETWIEIDRTQGKARV